jgi:hypothetical protein
VIATVEGEKMGIETLLCDGDHVQKIPVEEVDGEEVSLAPKPQQHT